MTFEELKALVQEELMSLADRFEDGDWDNAIDDAQRETWSLPTSVNFKIIWLKRRTKRHLFYMLVTKYADKFKYEGANLQHKFDHFWKLIQEEDRAFEKALEEHPELFLDVSAAQLFGHKIDGGFAYTELGQDVTYFEDNLVVISPSDSD